MPRINPNLVNIMMFCHGNTIGWMSPAGPTLRSALITPLSTGPISVSDEAFVGSIFSLGEILGNLLFTVLSKYVGLKQCTYLLVIPDLTFWIIVSQATLPWHLAVARVIAGTTGGGIYVTNPLFVNEVADRRNRGVLGTYMMTSLMVGVCCQFIIGSLVEYTTVPYLFMWIQPCFLVLWFLMPNTPHQYIMRQKMERAEKAFVFYRAGNDLKNVDQGYVTENVQRLKFVLESRQKNSKSLWNTVKIIYKWHISKPILIGLALGAILIFCGSFNVITYTTLILDKSGAQLDPAKSGIAVGLLQVFGTYGSTLLVDRMGRRKLLILSAGGAAISSALIGVFASLFHNGVDMSSVDFMPVVLLCVFVTSVCVGLLPVPFVVFSELMTTEYRVLGVGINILAISVYGLVSNMLFPLMIDAWGLEVAMWQSSAVSVIGIAFVFFILPETKGKDLDTIDSDEDV